MPCRRCRPWRVTRKADARGRPVAEIVAIVAAEEGADATSLLPAYRARLRDRFTAELRPVPGIAAALADTEFAIRAEEATNTLFARWRFLHILLGCLIFALLALHVGAAIYYGLRWL